MRGVVRAQGLLGSRLSIVGAKSAEKEVWDSLSWPTRCDCPIKKESGEEEEKARRRIINRLMNCRDHRQDSRSLRDQSFK